MDAINKELIPYSFLYSLPTYLVLGLKSIDLMIRKCLTSRSESTSFLVAELLVLLSSF